MKITFTLFLSSFFILLLPAQTQLILQPNATDGKDTHIGISANGDEGNGAGTATSLFNSAWTQSGVPYTHRSMVEFDLSALPANVTILDAKLSLFAFDGAEKHSQQSGSNACWLERITSTWDEDTVIWSNQPSTTTDNRVEIPATSDVNKDYELDVTNMVQDMANDPANSFGFLLKLQNEVRFRRMTFCTSDHLDASKHPKLVITYQITTAQIILQPNAADGKDSHIGISANGDEGNGAGTATSLFNSAWTQSGVPYTHRSMVEFDLSALPANATILDAKLSLFAFDGAEKHSQQSGSNACWLERITSTWDEDAVIWSNQPNTTTDNRVEIPATSDVNKDYELDVTNMVQDMANDPANSFGFLLKLQNEARFRRMTFCTSDHPDASKHPKLVISYVINTAQLNLKPNAADGKDSHIGISANGDEGNGAGTATSLFNSAWTQSGVPYTHRSMVEFDLSALPANATILDAKLNLFAFDGAEKHSQQSGSNACWLERITSTWDEDAVIWSNQPNTTTENRVEIPATSDVNKDYELDVTNMVQDMANDPANSFGFLLKLQNEARFRRMTFCTSDHPDATKHPSLNITYRIEDITCVEEKIVSGRISGAYTAKQVITATGTVDVSETATFIAPAITLLPGFHAVAGSTLSVRPGENCMADAFETENTATQSRITEAPLTALNTTEQLAPTTLTIAPNPFSHETALIFSISEQTVGQLAIFNANGQLVQTLFERKPLNVGTYTFSFQQRIIEKGLFYFVLKTDKEVIVKKGVAQ